MTDGTEDSEIDWYCDDKAIFGDSVVVAREVMSQKQLAKRLGVKLKIVSRWKNVFARQYRCICNV